jgi:hypothetical protein
MSYWDADRQRWVRGVRAEEPQQQPPPPPPDVVASDDPAPPEDAAVWRISAAPVPPAAPSAEQGAPRESPQESPWSATEPSFRLQGAPFPPPGPSDGWHDGSPSGSPPGPPREPTPDPPRGWSHARILAAAVAGVVLAAGLGVGGWALLGHDGKGHPAATGQSSAQVPTDIPTDVTTDVPTDVPTDTDTGTYSPTDSPTATEESTPPPGFVRTQDPAGFTLDVPADWQRSAEGASVFYRPADQSGLIQVFALTGAQTTPYDSLTATEKTVSKNDGYQQIRLEQVGDAAELEYTYIRPDSTVRHVVIHAYDDPSGIQYALLAGGPDSEWSMYEQIDQQLLASFCSTGNCPEDSVS